MHNFLDIGLETLKSEAGRRHPALKQAAKACLATLSDGTGAITVSPDDPNVPVILPSGPLWQAQLKDIMECLRLAAGTDRTKILSACVSLLESLLALGYLGKLADAEGHLYRDVAIELLGSCFQPKGDDEALQLQIVKACRTVVAAPACDVHRASLLNVVRTCYNIYLKARNPEALSTIKASLEQMLVIVFQRLPADDGDVIPVVHNVEPIVESAVEGVIEVEPEAGSEGAPAAPAKDVAEESEDRSKEEKVDDKLENNAEDGVGVEEEEEQKEVKGTQSQHPAEEKTDKEAQKKDVSAKAAPAHAAHAAQGQKQGKQTRGLFSSLVGALSLGSAQSMVTSKAQWGNELKIPEGDIEFSDCFLLFRALCKLSVKNVEQDTPEPFKSKVFALELVLSILEACGDKIEASKRFVDAVLGKYLALALIKNGVSPVPRVFQLAIRITRHVLTRFKRQLKPQCGVLWGNYLRLLESPHSATEQKMDVLRLMTAISQDPQALVEIYINYDCDVQGRLDLFEQIAKLAARGAAATQEAPPLRREALTCLETVLGALVNWADQCGALTRARQMHDDDDADEVADDDDGEEHDEHGRPKWLSDAPDPEAIEKFRKAKDHKLMIEEGRQQFALSQKKGLQYFLNAGLVENTPESIAYFLRTTPGLDLTKVGELLGGSRDLNKAVLHKYVDSFEFGNLDLDLALREFLYHFRIPGEAAIIDRILEKFAERYFSQNGDSIFPCADAAYVMSFSIMMLSTDLHSKAQAKKMTKAEWLENNRKYIPGMAEQWDEDYMSRLFDRIAAEAFQLQGADDAARSQVGLSDPLKRQMAFMAETQAMVKDSQAAIRAHATAEYFSAAGRVEHLEPMFHAVAFAVLAPLSVLLGQSNSARVVAQVLRCFDSALTISCLFGMTTERTTFVQTLAKFTGLRQADKNSPLQPKHLACIAAVLKLARENANFLQSSWSTVLGCISDIDRLRNIGAIDPDVFARANAVPAPAPARVEAAPASAPSADASSPVSARRTSAATTGLQSSPSASSVSDAMADETLPTSIDLAAIDRVFTGSVKLSGGAILDFVTGLCEVSRAEIEETPPRSFSLIKLVVVGYYNMNRIRWVWSRVWRVLASHFEVVGAHRNDAIAMHAIDSLRQLSMKFLEKDELANFSFQKEFLRPFELIMKKPPVRATRELIIHCLSQMIHARAANIRSGWKSIFAVFKVAASDPDESIVALAFATVETIMKEFFPLIAESFFVEVVSCLAAYGNNNLFKDIGLKAIASLQYCADQLASGAVVALEYPSFTATLGGAAPGDVVAADEAALPELYRFTDADEHMSMWFPILTGLAAVIAHPHIDVRTAALDALFGLLRFHGVDFAPSLWRVVFPGVLMPIFDAVRYAGSADGAASPDDEEWLNTSALNALRSLTVLVHAFHRRADFLLDDLLRLLSGCVLQGNESLAEIGTTTLLQFVVTAAPSFRDEDWRKVIDTIAQITTDNAHTLHKAVTGVLNVDDEGAKDDDEERDPEEDNTGVVRTCFTVQLLLVECVDTIVSSQFAHMGDTLASALLTCTMDVRRKAGRTRAAIEPLASRVAGQKIVAASNTRAMTAAAAAAMGEETGTIARARRASLAPMVDTSRVSLAQRYADTLERLEAAAAACAHSCARIAVDAASDDGVAACQRRLLLPVVRDTVDALAVRPCAVLGAVARVQMDGLRKDMPADQARRHLATLHAIGIAAAKGQDKEASSAGLDLISFLATLMDIKDEEL